MPPGRITKHQGLVVCSGGWLLGILGGSLWPTAFNPVVLYIIVALAMSLLALGYVQQPSGRRRLLLVGSLFVLGCALGTWQITRELAKPNEFATDFGHVKEWYGQVVAEPDVRETRQLIAIRPDGVVQRILVTVSKTDTFAYGDRVWFSGKLQAAKAFDDFDYPGYLARFDVFAISWYPKLLILQSHQGNWFVSAGLWLKQKMVQRLFAVYEPTAGNFVLGVLIGAKKGLSEQVQQNFRTIGASHILAASGFNVTILLLALGYAAYLIGRRWQLVLSALVIVLFVIMAGPSGSVLRAAGMGAVVSLAVASGRAYSPMSALAIVAAAMAVCSPRIVYFDVGFQLSLAATGGILLGQEIWQRQGYHVTSLAGQAGQLFWVTMSAIIATLPLSLWHFGAVSLISPVANLLIVPLVPWIMLLGGLSLLPLVGSGFAWIGSGAIGAILWLAAKLAAIPFALLDWSVTGVVAAVMYAGISALYLVWRWRAHRAQ